MDKITMDLGKGTYAIDSYMTGDIVSRFQRFGHRFRINYLPADEKFIVEVRDPIAKKWYGVKNTLSADEITSYRALINLFCN